MNSLYKLVLKTNIKSPVMLFPLVFPLIILLMYSASVSGATQEVVNLKVSTMIVTALSLLTMQSGLMGFGFNFIGLKKSILFKRIGASKLNKYEVVGAIMLYGLTIWLISFVWIIIWSAIFIAIGLFYSPEFLGTIDIPAHDKIIGTFDFSKIHWGYFFGAIIAMLSISFSMGMFFSVIAKDENMFQAIVMMYFFSVSLLSGLLFPGGGADWMKYVGYLIPHAYANELFSLATGIETVSHLGVAKTVLDFIIPIGLSIFFTIYSMKIVKFD